jgi:hypothetical protein
MSRSRKSPFLIAALAGAAATSAYALVIRPWHLSWGCTPGEIDRALPGDDIVPRPRLNATHAVTIQAPAGMIWPWLVQIGQGRGGFYTYDWLENLFGLNIHSANSVLPYLQQLTPGDIIPLEPGGTGIPVAELVPQQALVLGGRMDHDSPGFYPPEALPPGSYMAASWTFYLHPVDAHTTRLIERMRMDWDPPSVKNSLFTHVLLEPASFVMERGMLLGLKRRVEASLKRGSPEG